jgi:Zn-dependent M16 (insulinase) family peptidase
LQPDPEKGKMDEAQVLDRLAKVKASMTSADLAELAHATEELRLKQETPDPPETLKTVPSLVLLDIPKETATIPIIVWLLFSLSFGKIYFELHS